MAKKQSAAKLHVFEPSGRRVWTVAGSGDEHWVDPVTGVCSCRAFHYNRTGCVHISAASGDDYETVRFSDEEFGGFLEGLIDEIWARDTLK